MRLLSILLIFLTSINVSASNLSQEDQVAIIEKVAKSERRNLWVQGHDHVDSSVEKMSESSLKEYFEQNEYYENTLDESEEAELFSCLKSIQCELFLISVSSEYYSGYGVDSVFVQLNIKTGKFNNNIRHNVYSE